MITYASPLDFPAGTVSQLLQACHAVLAGHTNTSQSEFADIFESFDKEVYAKPEVADCVLVTCVDGTPVGVGVYDPREEPASASIAYNCVLPDYRGQDIGQRQITEMLSRLQQRGVERVRVSTGAGDMAQPVRQMYEACGFKEVRTHLDDWDDEMIMYEILLSSTT